MMSSADSGENSRGGADVIPANQTSPVHLTEASMLLTPSPRSLVTPSPKQPKMWSSVQGRPQTPFELLSPAHSHPNNSLEGSQRTVDARLSGQSWFTPKKSQILGSESELSVLRARKTHTMDSLKSELRRGLRTSSKEKFAFKDSGIAQVSEQGKDLKLVRKTLIEKDSLIRELQEIITELESKMKADRAELADLKKENQHLNEKIGQIEGEWKAKFASEIQRLASLLSENAKKFKDLKLQNGPRPVTTVSHSSPSKPESKEFCMFLLEENRRIEGELSQVKAYLKQNFETSLGAIAGELAGIRYDVEQIRTLMRCVKSGEQVQLDVFWGAHRTVEDKPKPGSYSTDCLKEVTTIKVCIADMKKVASDYYAEQCGQSCNTQ